MDPTVALIELRELAEFTVANPGVAKVTTKLERMAELFQALDEWISGGGFLPAPWDHSNP